MLPWPDSTQPLHAKSDLCRTPSFRTDITRSSLPGIGAPPGRGTSSGNCAQLHAFDPNKPSHSRGLRTVTALLLPAKLHDDYIFICTIPRSEALWSLRLSIDLTRRLEDGSYYTRIAFFRFSSVAFSADKNLVRGTDGSFVLILWSSPLIFCLSRSTSRA